NGSKAETLHLTVGPHPLALGLEAEATLGLFFAADANVTECGTHDVSSLRWAVRIPPGGTLASAVGKKSGREATHISRNPVASQEVGEFKCIRLGQGAAISAAFVPVWGETVG